MVKRSRRPVTRASCLTAWGGSLWSLKARNGEHGCLHGVDGYNSNGCAWCGETRGGS